MKKFVTCVVVIAMYVMTACSSPEETPLKEDSKPAESETSNKDTVGEDSEIQITTSTDGTGKTPTTEAESETTEKPTSTTTQATTEKKTPVQTQKQTTTSVPKTTTIAVQTGEQDESGVIELDISVSKVAEDTAANIVSSIISPSMSQYDRVKTIHDWIIKNVDYDYDGWITGDYAKYVHSAEGALCNKIAVCDGYAQAFELLCAKAGIQAYMIYGEAGNATSGWQSHAWNIVRIDGQWYQIDCAWDDPFVNDELVTDGSNITYIYFLLTDDEMYSDHLAHRKDSINIKSCTSTLYKGYAENLSVDAVLMQSANSKKVLTLEQFNQAIENFVASGIIEFTVAVPASVGTTTDMIGTAAGNGLSKAGKYEEYNLSVAIRYVCSYICYDVTVKKQ